MGTVSAFTAGYCHCKPLITDDFIRMTDVTVIHQIFIQIILKKVYSPQNS